MTPEEVLVPLSFFLCIAGVLVVFLLSRHKERMAIIEKGASAEEIRSLNEGRCCIPNPLTSLKWGMILSFVGIAILAGIWLRESFLMSEGVFPGLMAVAGGLALITFYLIAKKKV